MLFWSRVSLWASIVIMVYVAVNIVSAQSTALRVVYAFSAVLAALVAYSELRLQKPLKQRLTQMSQDEESNT